MSKDQVKVRYKLARARIRAGADKFFGDPSLENKSSMQNTAHKTQQGYGDFGEGPEDDLREESISDFRKDLQDDREG